MLRRTLTALLLFTSLAAARSVQQVALNGADAVVAAPGDNWEYSDCGVDSDAVQIQSITVSPDPPKIGEDLTVKIVADVKETVEEGATADVVVKVGRIKLLEKTFDLCEEARNANASISCPVEPGLHTIEQTVTLPKEVPKLKYVISVRGFTVEEEGLACVDLTVQFKPFFQFWDY
ncbi:ML domain-containing protein [Mycena chlorophos]|uniref:Phosphatidylglycerol/phosphatidylinositol transfer protein n=1 Tax=Mycena chlorophos TaxID=658473 RepID=A0A8H6WL40_MYCCL|nr:ML domain-containing protein [Mycena chlorophos]